MGGGKGGGGAVRPVAGPGQWSQVAYTLFTRLKLYPHCANNVQTMCKMMCDILHILYRVGDIAGYPNN